MHHKIRIAYLQLLRTAELCCFKAVSFATATLPEFDASALLVYSGCAGWSSLVARRAHNPKVVSSNLTPATNLSDSQGLVGCFQRALLLFGKDLGKKSVFPYQSQAIQSRTIRQVSRPRSVHHRR